MYDAGCKVYVSNVCSRFDSISIALITTFSPWNCLLRNTFQKDTEQQRQKMEEMSKDVEQVETELKKSKASKKERVRDCAKLAKWVSLPRFFVTRREDVCNIAVMCVSVDAWKRRARNILRKRTRCGNLKNAMLKSSKIENTEKPSWKNWTKNWTKRQKKWVISCQSGSLLYDVNLSDVVFLSSECLCVYASIARQSRYGWKML